MKKLIALTGAGISAESGIKTFRDQDGLWENYHIEDVATYQAWKKNPALVQEFYNQRRAQLEHVKPNKAHYILAELESFFDVHIITQNVDDLHERAGSSNILHLHGELTKVRSEDDDNEIITIGYKAIKIGDKSPTGGQLRPHIVWFGEAVPLIPKAIQIVQSADIIAVIGTSMQVYPAASLIHYANSNTKCYYIDPKATKISGVSNLQIILDTAVNGVNKFKEILLNQN